jgi:hypothetical protein
VLAAEHLLDFAGLHFGIESVEGGRELGVHRLTRFGPFDEDGQIVAFFPQRQHQIAILLEPPAALQRLLRFDLIFPEVGRGRTRLETIQFFVGTGCLKDSSADRRRVY